MPPPPSLRMIYISPLPLNKYCFTLPCTFKKKSSVGDTLRQICISLSPIGISYKVICGNGYPSRNFAVFATLKKVILKGRGLLGWWWTLNGIALCSKIEWFSSADKNGQTRNRSKVDVG